MSETNTLQNTSGKSLYDYQKTAIKEIFQRFENAPDDYHLLYQLPTGGGKTVIFSSHIMSEVDLLCDDIAIIHNGELLYNDTMDEFRKQMQAENLTAEFIRIVGQQNQTK